MANGVAAIEETAIFFLGRGLERIQQERKQELSNDAGSLV